MCAWWVTRLTKNIYGGEENGYSEKEKVSFQNPNACVLKHFLLKCPFNLLRSLSFKQKKFEFTPFPFLQESKLRVSSSFSTAVDRDGGDEDENLYSTRSKVSVCSVSRVLYGTLSPLMTAKEKICCSSILHHCYQHHHCII